MKNKKAKLLSILLSLSMLGTAPVYGEDFSDFSDNLVASDEADPEVSVSSDDTSQDSRDFQMGRCRRKKLRIQR